MKTHFIFAGDTTDSITYTRKSVESMYFSKVHSPLGLKHRMKKEQLKAKQDKILAEKKEEREKAKQEFLKNKKMASTGANRAEGQVDAKGGVKFELVGIPEVMLEE